MNFRAPNGNRSAGAFGTITTTYDPRIIQFGFKANFYDDGTGTEHSIQLLAHWHSKSASAPCL